MANLSSYKVPIIDDVNSYASQLNDDEHPNASLLCKYYNELIEIIEGESAGNGSSSNSISYAERQKAFANEYANWFLIIDYSEDVIPDENYSYGSDFNPFPNIQEGLNYVNGFIHLDYSLLTLKGKNDNYYDLGDLENDAVLPDIPVKFSSEDGESNVLNIFSLKYGGYEFRGFNWLGLEGDTGTKLNAQDCYLDLSCSDISNYTGSSTFSSMLSINRCICILGGYDSDGVLNFGANDPNASIEIINSDVTFILGPSWLRMKSPNEKTIRFYGSKIKFSGLFDYNLTSPDVRDTNYYFEDCDIEFTCTIRNVPHKLFTFNRCVIRASNSDFSIGNAIPIFGGSDIYTLIYKISSTTGVPSTGTASTIVLKS